MTDLEHENVVVHADVDMHIPGGWKGYTQLRDLRDETDEELAQRKRQNAQWTMHKARYREEALGKRLSVKGLTDKFKEHFVLRHLRDFRSMGQLVALKDNPFKVDPMFADVLSRDSKDVEYKAWETFVKNVTRDVSKPLLNLFEDKHPEETTIEHYQRLQRLDLAALTEEQKAVCKGYVDLIEKIARKQQQQQEPVTGQAPAQIGRDERVGLLGANNILIPEDVGL